MTLEDTAVFAMAMNQRTKIKKDILRMVLNVCNLIGGINQFLMGDLTLVTVYLDRNEPSGTFQMDFSDESQCLVVTERHGRDHLMRTLSLDTEEEVAVLPNLSPCSLQAYLGSPQ